MCSNMPKKGKLTIQCVCLLCTRQMLCHMFDLYNNPLSLGFYGKRPKITVARLGLESPPSCWQDLGKNLSLVSPVSILGVVTPSHLPVL